MKYCKGPVLAALFSLLLLCSACSSFGKGSCDRCPEFTEVDNKDAQKATPQLTKHNDAE